MAERTAAQIRRGHTVRVCGLEGRVLATKKVKSGVVEILLRDGMQHKHRVSRRVNDNVQVLA